MVSQRLVGAIGLVALAIGVATSALLGPLGFGVIEFRLSAGMENQWIGAEVVSLGIVAPVALAAAWLWLRDDPLAPVVALGPALYAIYTYFTAVVFPEYDRYPGNNEQFFFFYVGILALSAGLSVGAWRRMGDASVPLVGGRVRRLIALLLIVVAVMIALTWARQIADVLVDETSMIEYQEHPTGFWTIKLLDYAIIVPALLLTGIGIARRHPLALRVMTPMAGFMGLLVSSVAAMAIVMLMRDDPSASVPFAALSTPAAALFLVIFGWLLRGAGRSRNPDQQERGGASQQRGDQVRRAAHSPSS